MIPCQLGVKKIDIFNFFQRKCFCSNPKKWEPKFSPSNLLSCYKVSNTWGLSLKTTDGPRAFWFQVLQESYYPNNVKRRTYVALACFVCGLFKKWYLHPYSCPLWKLLNYENRTFSKCQKLIFVSLIFLKIYYIKVWISSGTSLDRNMPYIFTVQTCIEWINQHISHVLVNKIICVMLFTNSFEWVKIVWILDVV